MVNRPLSFSGGDFLNITNNKLIMNNRFTTQITLHLHILAARGPCIEKSGVKQTKRKQ